MESTKNFQNTNLLQSETFKEQQRVMNMNAFQTIDPRKGGSDFDHDKSHPRPLNNSDDEIVDEQTHDEADVYGRDRGDMMMDVGTHILPQLHENTSANNLSNIES